MIYDYYYIEKWDLDEMHISLSVCLRCGGSGWAFVANSRTELIREIVESVCISTITYLAYGMLHS
jgi:hypothetical protein